MRSVEDARLGSGAEQDEDEFKTGFMEVAVPLKLLCQPT